MDAQLRRLEDVIKRPSPDFERLRRVLMREGNPDFLPLYELYVNLDVMAKLLGKEVKTAADTVEFYYKAGYDYVPVWPGVSFELGSLVDTSSHYPIKDWKTFEEYEWPDLDSIGYSDFEAVARILPEGMKIIGQYPGVLETVEGLFGFTGLCYMLHDDPELVEAVFEKVQAVYESMYKGMASIGQVGAVVISDDMGFKTQTLLSAENLRRYVLPCHKRLCEIIHKAGKPCILHSCGQLSSIMDDIIHEVGIDAKHSYEEQILPVTKAKELYGERLAILGGVDVDYLCRYNEPDLREYIRDIIEKCNFNGGYALGSGNSIASYIPLRNYLILLEEGWKFRI